MVGPYPPASTFKLATAIAGVRKGILTKGTACPSLSRAGWRTRGAMPAAGGAPGTARWTSPAIEKSCNVYFYQLGIRLGLEMRTPGTRMGFNRRTGIDLPGEKRPYLPGQPSTGGTKNFNYIAPSEVMSLAIGQGPNSQTVLQWRTSTRPSRGTAPRRSPHLVYPSSGEAGAASTWASTTRGSRPLGGVGAGDAGRGNRRLSALES